ncbi:MAG: rhodanese-like domain-containing protein [Nitrospirae bacterium]|nr:rhodanese-like domain-containing protein [Nitrospirota bacterium]
MAIKKSMGLTSVFLLALMVLPVFAQEDDISRRMNDVLLKAAEDGHWQVSADELHMWIQTKKDDFLVIDVRPAEDAYKTGHIPGALHIPYNRVLTPENLMRLKKDKKIILVCATGQLENLPVVPLRILGYEAYTLAFGYASWLKKSGGAEQMKAVTDRANKKNYPVAR